MHPHWTFDPDGRLDALVEGYVDGFPVYDPPAELMPPPDPFSEVDPSIPAEAIPAEPAATEGPTAEDSAWWAEQTAAHCPADVPLATYPAMCDDAELGPVGFCAGFELHPGDWPTSDDAPLPVWDEPALAGC